MLNNLERTIHEIIVNAASGMASEIGKAVRHSLTSAIMGGGGAAGAAANHAGTAAAPAKRGPGRPRKTQPTEGSAGGAASHSSHAAAATAQAAPSVKSGRRRGRPPGSKSKGGVVGRRSPEQVAKDDQALLDFIRQHRDVRSLEIQAAIKMASQNVASGLKRLREQGKINMKGVKASATYSAA